MLITAIQQNDSVIHIIVVQSVSRVRLFADIHIVIHILKSRDITLLTKVRIAKAMVFLVVMYQCESWTIKKA